MNTRDGDGQQLLSLMPIVVMADDSTTTTSSSNKNTTSSSGSGSGSSLGSKHRMRTTLYYTAIVIALIATGIHMVTLDEWALVDLSTIGDDTRGMIASTVWKTTTNTTDDNNNSNRTGSTGTALSANNKPITTITNKTITTKNGTVAIATTTTTTVTTTTTTTAAIAIASEKNVSSQNATITFLVQLSGEFGNNLQKIIRGWGVAKLAYEEFGIKSHIVYQEQQGRKQGSVILKAKKTTQMIQKCFIKPNFKNANFQLGNDIINVQPNYFNEIIKHDKSPSFTVSDAYQSTDDIRNNLSILSNYIKKNPQVLLEQQNLNETIYEKENYNGFDWTVSSSPLPGIPKGMVPVSSLKEYVFVNEYYDSMLKTFIFNDEECCGDDTNYPYEDESVLVRIVAAYISLYLFDAMQCNSFILFHPVGFILPCPCFSIW